MSRAKRISPGMAAVRLLLLLLIIAVPLGASPVIASEETSGSATPVGSEPPPDDGLPAEDEPTVEPAEPVVSETATPQPVEITPTGSVPADTPSTPEGSPVATADTTPEPANLLACDKPENATILPGETYDLPCTYTVNDPDLPISVSASFEPSGDGWLVTIIPAVAGESMRPAAETAEWNPATPPAGGTVIELIVRVLAPADVTRGQTVALTVTRDGEPTPTSTVDLAVGEDDITPANVTTSSEIRCSIYSSPRPLGWDDAIVYRCAWNPGAGVIPNDTFGFLNIDQAAYEAGWNLAQVAMSPGSTPQPRREGPAGRGVGINFGGTYGGNPFPLAFYITVWTPTVESPVSQVSGMLYFRCSGCAGASGGVTFTASVGESSGQTGNASLTCIQADGDSVYAVSPETPSVLTCTVEALDNDINLIAIDGTSPASWQVTATGDLEDPEYSGTTWQFTPAPASTPMARGDTYSFDLSIQPSECGISSTSPSLSINVTLQRGSTPVQQIGFDVVLTADPADITRPASASFNFSPFDFGSGSWNEDAGGTIVSTFAVLPPSCLAVGTTQRVSLSIAGNGNSFRSTSGGTLDLSQLTLWDVSGDSSFPDMTALPITPGTAVTTSPDIVSITAAGNTPRIFWTQIVLIAPAGTPPGTYSATITLEITGGDN